GWQWPSACSSTAPDVRADMSATEHAIAAAPSGVSIVARLDRAIGSALELSTAGLVAIEIVILFVGIVARYVFHSPLIWSDELASMLCLWLAMLGGALALRRGEHMRMTALVARASHRWQTYFEHLSVFAFLGFLLAILPPAIKYVDDEAIVSLMALDISMSWRAAAMPVGVGLMIVTALLRFDPREKAPALAALATVVALFAIFWLLHPVFPVLGRLNLLIFFFGVVAAAVFAGAPIAVAFGLSTLGYLALSTHVPLSVLIARMDTGMSHPVLLSVPLFVFLGLLIEMTGMARVMVQFLANLLGHLRGGMSFVLVGAMYLISGISGSKAADMA